MNHFGAYGYPLSVSIAETTTDTGKFVGVQSAPNSLITKSRAAQESCCLDREAHTQYTQRQRLQTHFSIESMDESTEKTTETMKKIE